MSGDNILISVQVGHANIVIFHKLGTPGLELQTELIHRLRDSLMEYTVKQQVHVHFVQG